MTPKEKRIEVVLPLEAINVASAHQNSIRHGHPSTLHLWWALAASCGGAKRLQGMRSSGGESDNRLSARLFPGEGNR
jgi:hypothetical protein